MATLTRTNPTAVARGTIQELTSVSMFKVVLSGSGLAVAASDAAAAKLSDALGGMAQIIQFKANGLEIYMVADNHGADLNSIAQAVGSVLDTGTLGTLTGGVQTLSDSQTVTVTKPTDIEAI
tara:strand:- start:1177 stop:1542 length:366 start_codon:yes stop_codon:yes gene_type:complete